MRRDFTSFQHVHPVLDDKTGVWSVGLDLAPGRWRLFADFTTTGADALTLGTDLAVGGDYRPAAPATENNNATVDGYEVTLDGDQHDGVVRTAAFTGTADSPATPRGAAPSDTSTPAEHGDHSGH